MSFSLDVSLEVYLGPCRGGRGFLCPSSPTGGPLGHSYFSMCLQVSLRFQTVPSYSTLAGLQYSQVPRKGQGQNYCHRFHFLSDPRAPQAGLSQVQGPILLFPFPTEAQLWDLSPQAGRLGGLSWPPVPSARPAGLSTDPQAAGGWCGRRGLERAAGTHPLPNTPSTRPAPGKERGGNQRDLDKGWGHDSRGKVRDCHCFMEGNGSKLVPLPLNGKGRGLPSHHGDGCTESNLRRTLGPYRAGVKEKRDWGIEQLRRRLKLSTVSKASSSSSPSSPHPVFALAQGPG